MTLSAADFPAFFEALSGYPPFPWQARLAAAVLAEGWPATLALPTASGKTACMDIAVFARAVAAGGGGAGPPQARRVFFVVDRRIVVDDAYDRARRMADRLAEADSGVLREVADRLRDVGGEQQPLVAAILRGGIYRDDRWARSPAQPTVVVGTVDQVGSRLLQRGYGISPFGWPIHAGLVGNDSLILVDEAHCSRPFVQTLEWVCRYRRGPWAPDAPDAPLSVVTLTATPSTPERVFELGEDDLDHPVLGPRLRASKPAALAVAPAKEAGFVKEVAGRVRDLAAQAPRVVAAVVNRVATARSVFEHVRALAEAGRCDADVLLLTGRVRPADRDALLGAYASRLRADPGRPPAARSLVVVATQCIEVGADLDFDALVTECCPLDALRQRFGRLDRLGRHGTAPAAIVVRAEQTESDDDPVYGPALSRTWQWLNEVAEGEGDARRVDLGVLAADALLDGTPGGRGELVTKLAAPAPDAPVLLPAHLDAWVRTSPPPHADPDPAVFLHGPDRGTPDVTLVWRGDLPPDATGTWAEAVSLCPPSSGEALSLPLPAARAWLSGAAGPTVADVEGAGSAEEARARREDPDAGAARPALRWRGPESADTGMLEAPDDVRPGDTLVIPSGYGGCDRFGWAPESTEPVTDLGDLVQAGRRRAVLRLHPGVIAGWAGGPREADAAWLAELRGLSESEVPPEDAEVREALGTLAAAEGCPEWLRSVARHLAAHARVRPHPSGAGLVVTTPRPLPIRGELSDFSDEDSSASAGAAAVTLRQHADHVRERVLGFARALGFDPGLTGDLALAAALHDLGKADPRFQLWLHGGDRLAAARCTELLAKSSGAPRTRRTDAAARRASGYPLGARHELVSVGLVEEASVALRGARDRELVLHLVGSHHGRCRPFAPATPDPAPARVAVVFDGEPLAASSATGLERLDSGVAERFWRLVRRYGWWGLAGLEAALRLADHRASEAEEEGRT